MNNKLLVIAERRDRLVTRIATQRTLIGECMEPWRVPLARVDQGLGILRYVQRRPALVVGAGLLLLTLRPSLRGAWLGRGWLIWQMWHRLRSAGRSATPALGEP
ncbi:MAG: YqjK-like family protein [Porticoccaceae bacterium]|nr:YqjK-like family protein [Porticoccaceae bacterium]